MNRVSRIRLPYRRCALPVASSPLDDAVEGAWTAYLCYFFAFDAKGAPGMNEEVRLTLPQAMQHAAAAYDNREWAKAENLARLILNAQADYFDARSEERRVGKECLE